MVPAIEHGSAPREGTVGSVREARTQRLHPACQREAVRRFDDEVRMIVLKRVVQHAEFAAFVAIGERVLEGAYEPDASERRHVRADADRYVAGEKTLEGLSRPVPDARPRPARPAGARARSAPAGDGRQVESQLTSAA
jgi:hypothetical protein